ncbi:MAG: MGH1-like glycoside hydrolase domain-containing protein, partial [Acutalibacteraceae bacterium]
MEMAIRILSGLLTAAVLAALILPIAAAAKPETLDNGYQMDLENLPRVHFGDHPAWEELFDATWKSLTTTIKKANASLNSKEVYYVDKARAFTNTVFAWDTMFTLMFTKYAQNEFPMLPSLDTFYEHQIDSNGEDDGYIPREINQSTGRDVWAYDDVRSMNPPLWAWAEWDLYQTHGDASQFTRIVKGKTVYERMKQHYAFIERYKKLDNGLYGKTNGYGNGLDNTFNQGEPYIGGQVQSNGDQTYNDLSLQQAQFAYYLSKIAAEIGNEEDAAFYAQEHERIAALIRDKMWDDGAHMFSNLAADGVTHTNVSTPTTLWALAAHVATAQQAQELIQYHGENSQKLYRPYGLATTAYDHPGYEPVGNYWRGSFWGPTSYQYIKGLEDYGYDEIALEESIRHMTSVLGVWQAGLASGNAAQTNPLWENYSSEYLKRGSISNPDYGWIGTVSVGVMIEDILGLKPHAAENTVNWSIRLTEEHGVDDLRFVHDGVENVVSFMAEKRTSAKDPVCFSVIAKEPFTLVVKNGAISRTYDVKAGANWFTIDGESGKAPVSELRVLDFSEAGKTLTPARFDAALDSVLFGTQTNPSVYDGLPYQSGKTAGMIRNVNSIGFSMAHNNDAAPRFQASGTMRGLGFTDAREAVKNYHSSGEQGFMFTVPADQSLQTMTAIVGVRNGTARFTADLTDASTPTRSATLTGGAQESVYVLEMPYRASKDGYHVLVKYTLTSSTGSVSLKGILLEKGGDPAPGELTLTPADGSIAVDAQALTDDPAEQWKVYYGDEPTRLDHTLTVDSMPCTLENLANGKPVYLAVESVTGGKASARTRAAFEIPEKEPLSWEERLDIDLQRALPTILNGNEGTVSNRFVPVAVGPIYHSDLAFSSDSDGEEAGVQNTGGVIRPVGKSKTTVITVSASHGDKRVSRSFVYSVPPLDLSAGYVIAGDPILFTGTAYLSRDGEKDWMQIIRPDGGAQAKKQNGAGIDAPRFLNGADPTGSMKASGNCSLSYQVTDPGDPAPINNRVVEIHGIGNAVEIPLGYSVASQRTFVYYTLAANTTARVAFSVNGEVREEISAFAKTRGTYRIEFDYLLDDPADQAAVRLTLTDAPADGWAAINAVTLRETPSPFNWIPANDESYVPTSEEYNRLTQVSGHIDLTGQGNLDWIQLCQNTPIGAPQYARKQNGAGLSDLREITVVNNANADHQMSTDFDLFYDYTDCDPTGPQPKDRYGLLRRGDGNGVQFAIDPRGGKRTLRVYTGNYKARSLLEYVVNGETRYSTYIDNDGRIIFCTTLMIDLQEGDEAYIRHTLVDQFKYGDPYGCSITYAATLGEFEGINPGTTLPAEYPIRNVRGDDPRIEESTGGWKDIGYLDVSRWVSYAIDVEKTGRYDLSLEYATSGTGTVDPGLKVEIDGRVCGEITSM